MTEHSATTNLAARVGRHSTVYTMVAGLVAVIGLTSLAVFTRLMPPSQYGKLALLISVSSVLTLLYSVGSSQGILGKVFAGADDADAGDDDDDDDQAGGEDGQDRERRRDMLGTGMLWIAGVASVGTVATCLSAPALSDLILGDAGQASAIRLAAASGALSALWRLLTAIPRLERRPTRFMLFQVGQPLISLIVAVPFVARGDGAEGVMTGAVLTTGALVVIALVWMRGTYRVRFRPALLPPMLRRGGLYVPLVLCNWIIGHSGSLILSRFASGTEVGYFRVASVLGGIVTIWTSAFFMAWLPLKRTSAFKAANRERGIRGVSSLLTTWFTIGVLGMFVVVAAGADVLVRVAGPEYEPAAWLIPFVAFSAVAHSAFLLSYRIAVFPRSRLALICLAILAMVTFVTSAVLLVPVMGSEAVPVATTIAFGLAGGGMLVLVQRSKRPIPFEYGRLARTALAAGVCVTAARGLAGPAGAWVPALSVGAILLYPALLFGLRVVPRREVGVLMKILRTILRPQRRDRPGLVARLSELSPGRVETLRLAAARRPASDSPAEVVEALRFVGEIGEPGDLDRAVGRYLLSGRSRAERDATARVLWGRGVDPSELDRLEQTLEALRRLPARAWSAAARGAEVTPAEPAREAIARR